MALPTETITMENYTAGVLLLPQGSRNVVVRIAEVEADVEIQDTVISLTSSAPATVIKAGQSLSFGVGANPTLRQHVLVLEDATLNDTTPTDVIIAPSKFAIAEGATARVIDGLESIFGIQDFALQESTTVVDVTNTHSGTGTEEKPVRSARTYQISGKEFRLSTTGDKGLDIIKRVCRTPGLFGRELYMVSIYPDGETVEGAFIVKDFNQPGNYNEVKAYSFTATLQGNSFNWITAYA